MSQSRLDVRGLEIGSLLVLGETLRSIDEGSVLGAATGQRILGVDEMVHCGTSALYSRVIGIDFYGPEQCLIPNEIRVTELEFS